MRIVINFILEKCINKTEKKTFLKEYKNNNYMNNFNYHENETFLYSSFKLCNH